MYLSLSLSGELSVLFLLQHTLVRLPAAAAARIAAARAAAEAFCLHLIIIVATVLPTYTCTRAYPGSWSKPHTKRGVCRLPSYCENIIHCTFLLHHFYRPSLCALAPLSTPLASCTCKLALWQCDNKML